MTHMQGKVSPLQRSIWGVETNIIDDTSSSSIQLQSRSSFELSPAENFLQKPTSELSEQHPLSQNNVDATEQGCLGCSSWPKTFAFIICLGTICAAAILLPIILTNTFGRETTLTTTTVRTTSSITTILTTTTTSSSTSSSSFSVTSTSTSTSTTTTTSKTTSTSSTTTTTSICGVGCASTSTSTTSRLAFYTFDSNTLDATGIYSASGIPSPTYTTGYVGSAISFNASLSQRLSATAMSLNSRSFTIEFWFLLVDATSYNYAFFGQMDIPNTGDQCLFLVSRLGKPTLGFFNDDIISSTVLQSNTWYHAAFVYDYNKYQQFIYINGLLDIQSAVGAGPYLGTSGPITIGGADIYGSLGVPYLTGVMDHLIVSTRVKTACEILNDATLAVYLPFDASLTDAGPNFLTATSSGASIASGIVNQAVYLLGSNSYVQISGLTGIGQTNQSFSIAFWMYLIVPGVLVHVHSLSTGGGWCTPFIGISSSGKIITQVYNSPDPYIIQGPVIQLNTWTHIVQTYSPTNGQRLYINGILYTSLSNATIYTASGVQNFVTIGNLLNGAPCYNPGVLQTPIEGMIDELRIYSRELSSTDVCVLAWL